MNIECLQEAALGIMIAQPMSVTSHTIVVRMALRLALGVGLLVASPAWGQSQGAAAAPSHCQGLLPRLANAFRNTGVTVSCGVLAGVPGAEASVDLGYLKAAKGDPRGSGLFASAGGMLAVASYRQTFSPRPGLRGREIGLGPMGRGSPVYGDRVSVPIVPGVASLSASRKGGLGLCFSAIPLPVFYPVVRGQVSVFLTNPALAGVSCRLLDGVDRVGRAAKRIAQPLIRLKDRAAKRIAPPLNRLKDRAAKHQLFHRAAAAPSVPSKPATL
jgi:hypothetical protein